MTATRTKPNQSEVLGAPSFALEDSASTLQVSRQLGLVTLELPGVAVPGGCRRHPGRGSGPGPWL